jgi:hypothetical protein
MTVTRRELTLLAIGLAALALAFLGATSPHAQTAEAPLVQAPDLTYVGAFRVPAGGDDQHTFSYGGTALAFDSRDGGLWMVGHAQQQRAAEITIPTPSPSTSLADLPRAALKRDFSDLLAGKMDAVGSGDVRIGGILPWSDGLVVSAYVYYDASGAQTLSHFGVAADGTVSGPYRIGTTKTGMVSGYMAAVPPGWQSALGGPALTGQCCIPIISRTSLGPTATVFDPSALSSQSKAVQVLGYPIDHPTLGTYEDTNPDNLFLMATAMGGVVFPAGTRSVLFIGAQPGSVCYGEGTSTASQAGQPTPDGSIYCYDPTSSYKGNHGYPWRGFVWAYDANDLVAVKQGQKQPWQVTPYATWSLTAPFMGDGKDAVLGASYDPATRRVFVSLGSADRDTPDHSGPIVAVYQLSVGVGSGSANEHPPTPVDAIVSAWSAWSPTSDLSACVGGQQTRTEQRTRTVTTPAANGGSTPSLVDTRTTSQICTVATTLPETTPDLAALVTAEVTRQLAAWPRPTDGHDGARGPVGPAGPSGPAGPQGAAGPAGPAGSSAAPSSGALLILMGQRDAPSGTTLVGRLTLAPGVMVTVVRAN